MPAPHRLASLYAAKPDEARERLKSILSAHGEAYGAVRYAADVLGVHEVTVHRWIAAWGLSEWIRERRSK